jgi:uncharacterized protein YegP (UPF0339 family)
LDVEHVVPDPMPKFRGKELVGVSKATFELYEDAEGKYRWRLVHDNGNIIADSGEGYANRTKAKQGIESVKTNAPDAAIEEVEN